jgi:hypothetical protein
MHHLDELFLIQVYFGLVVLPLWKLLAFEFLLDIWDFALSSVYCSSVTGVSTNNIVCTEADVSGVKKLILNHIL